MRAADDPGLGPYCVELEQGKTYFWCRCGRSKRQPFCDGSHHGSGMEPVRFDAERSEAAWLCGCKRSAAAPMCDGSHKQKTVRTESADE